MTWPKEADPEVAQRSEKGLALATANMALKSAKAAAGVATSKTGEIITPATGEMSRASTTGLPKCGLKVKGLIAENAKV